MGEKLASYMVQYGVWTNCCNDCDFCLRKIREPESKETQLDTLEQIGKNIDHIDWNGKFSAGISLLGGEIFYVKDPDIQDAFIRLIDIAIERILKASPNPNCKISTVTNGLYSPEFLYRVADRIRDSVGIERFDLNFSYDLKYRYRTESDRMRTLKNINDYFFRYGHPVGVQMILTQNVINLWKRGEFDINKFIASSFPGNDFAFLYPHKIHTGRKLDDFFFRRSDLLDFMMYLRKANHHVYDNFILSTKHSSLFKYTGYKNRGGDVYQQPVLCDDKEIMGPCGHSVLYRCYSDTDKCMMCDIENIDYGTVE